MTTERYIDFSSLDPGETMISTYQLFRYIVQGQFGIHDPATMHRLLEEQGFVNAKTYYMFDDCPMVRIDTEADFLMYGIVASFREEHAAAAAKLLLS